MRWLILLLAVLLLILQFHLWVGEGSFAEVSALRKQNEVLKQELEQMRAANDRLAAEVVDLKSGTEAVEERARNELGMIRDGETFIQIIEKKPKTDE
jgi:cell division protein FtsB